MFARGYAVRDGAALYTDPRRVITSFVFRKHLILYNISLLRNGANISQSVNKDLLLPARSRNSARVFEISLTSLLLCVQIFYTSYENSILLFIMVIIKRRIINAKLVTCI